MTSIAVGNRRLLRLAKILDTADALHKKRKEPGFDMRAYRHDCGSPACALGHYAAATPKRWMFDAKHGSHIGGYPHLKTSPCGIAAVLPDSEEEFAIDQIEWQELFSSCGCGGAITAKQAAKYIRAFVKRRSGK